MNLKKAAGKHNDVNLNILLWGALGLGGFYLFKRYEKEGMGGNFDVENFIEEGSEILPHPAAKHPMVKKIAGNIIRAQMKKRSLK